MYELLVLSLLLSFPVMHGYGITKIANDAIGPWVKISSGTLYPLLTRLEQQGLIHWVAQGQTDKRLRSFAITEAGRQRFHQLMMDTSSNLGEYQRLFYSKLPYLELLLPEERLYLLDHYSTYCQTALLHYQAEAQDFIHALAHPQPHHDTLNRKALLTVMQHTQQFWQQELEWVKGLREEMVAQIEQEGASTTPGDASEI
jgi:DNA-binding PadR family transcriptional regulator